MAKMTFNMDQLIEGAMKVAPVSAFKWHEAGELNAHYDARKEFYGKAHVVNLTIPYNGHRNSNIQVLLSYGVPVAKIINTWTGVETDSSRVRVDQYLWINGNENHLTNTTLRHIKEFVQQYWNDADDPAVYSKSQLIKQGGMGFTRRFERDDI